MMFKPCGPSAVPTGGAGVALPAGNCNLMVVCIFFGGILLPQILWHSELVRSWAQHAASLQMISLSQVFQRSQNLVPPASNVQKSLRKLSGGCDRYRSLPPSH